MKRLPPRAPILVAWLQLAAYGLYLAFRYDALPARVASHFDAGGEADGFQSKLAFAITTSSVGALLASVFTVAPALLRNTPRGMINIPDREHWLAPERRDATLARLAVYNDWLGLGTMAMTCGLFVLIVRANLHDQRLGMGSWLLLVAFLAFALAHTVVLVRGFHRRD